MKRYVQLFLQAAFFVLFIVLVAVGRINLWMGLFVPSIVASLFLGRVYCGWICPINPGMNLVTWLKRKLNIKSFNIPKALMKPAVRYLFFGLFFIILIFNFKNSQKLPVLPLIILLGMIITLFFNEEMFHRFLCPFGTILHFTSSKTKLHMSIDEDKCNNCGKCMRVCPAKAVEKGQTHNIIKMDCLVCMKCSKNCKQNAISYK